MIGNSISHYKILEKLGEGGMGVVYKAEDIKLERIVALKFLPPSFSFDDQAKTRFTHEARAASALDHSNICNVHEIGETEDGQLFISMALYEGETLKAKISKGPLSVDESITIFLQICEGLSKAHQNNIIHRDIKPANIFITNDGVVKILDFGLAKVSGQTQLTLMGSTIGTVAYMSPEQSRGQDVDHRTDIWSLGVVLYEMLTGQLPFKGDYEHAVIYSLMNEEPIPVKKVNPAVPTELEQIVNKALRKNPESRYSSAAKMLKDLKDYQDSLRAAEMRTFNLRTFLLHFSKPKGAVPLVVGLLVIVLASVWFSNRQSKILWARQELLPEIERLAEDIPWTGEGPSAWEAFQLATQAQRYIPDDPVLNRLWPRISRYVKIHSKPTNARVYAKPYVDPKSEWRYFGQTPLDSLRFPRGFSRIKLELEGFQTVQDLFWALSLGQSYKLSASDSIPREMVLVQGETRSLSFPGLDHLEAEHVNDFWMDRNEVTNKAYKHFVDSRGYENKAYWKYPLIHDGRELNWKEAMALFQDKTGRPGPATWEAGDYREGEDDYPVTGVSWYEAAAYAEFVGKSLPSVFHWNLAAFTRASGVVIPFSNFSNNGLAPVGSYQGMTRYGTFNMAGNAREWTFNQGNYRGHRFILGGGWNDPTYTFNDIYTQQAFDRSPTNGFRCIKYLEANENQVTLTRTIKLPFLDFKNEKPVSDEMFKILLRQFEYDKTPLNSRIELIDESARDWTKEKITFDAAYGNERVIAYLFLPKRGKPPYQTVVYFPGDAGFGIRSSDRIRPPSHLLKSGRAFLYPIYKSTYERGDELPSSMPNESNIYKEHMINWAKDLRRSVDYLETRDDVDADKLAYYGRSWGARIAPIMLVVENRFKVSILEVAGLRFQRAQPEADPFNFLSRTTLPVLMLNGRYDFYFPFETSQKPFFELLGTTKQDKKWLVYEGSHIVPNIELVKETLAWLDRYLGPVK